MTAARQSALDHGWVAITFFLIFGGLFASAMAFAAFDFTSWLTPYAVAVSGALIGGWFAGRLSPHQRLNEPITANVFMTISIVACTTSTALGPALWQESVAVIVRRSLLLGGIALAGTLLGALIGRARARRADDARRAQTWHWVGMSFFLTLGIMGLAFLVWASLLYARGFPGTERAAAAVGALFAIMAVAAILGGFATQVLTERYVPWLAGTGGSLAIVALSLLGTMRDGDKELGSVLIGTLILAGLIWPFGRIGTGLGWRVRAHVADRRARALPGAQAL